jgi:hypothetical protein
MQKSLLYSAVLLFVLALLITFLVPYMKILRDILIIIGLVSVILGLTLEF